MKTVCNKKTDESLHIFTDSTKIYFKNNSLWIGYNEREDFEMKGYDEENFIIYENIDAPSYWLSRTYQYNPEYGWKYMEDYSSGEEWYETYLRVFLKNCEILRKKEILTEEEYNELLDFTEIEKLLYHKIDYYKSR